jgi:hypothetical protein
MSIRAPVRTRAGALFFMRELQLLLRLAWVLALSAVACAAFRAGADTPPVAAYLEKDRDELVAMMAGTWSNDRQVFFAKDAGYASETVAPEQTLVLAPDPGTPLVLRAEQSLGNGPALALTHVFRVDPPGHSIVQDVRRSNGDDFGCDIVWTRTAGAFAGRAAGETCEKMFPRPEGAAAVEADLTLTDGVFSVVTRRGDKVQRAEFRKARLFTCWTGILIGAKHGDSGEGLSDWDFREDVALHDQGGEAVIATRETPSRRVRLVLRDVDWPFGTRRPSLTLYVHEDDDARAVSYAWTEGGADRIGINLRWMQTSCTRVGADD